MKPMTTILFALRPFGQRVSRSRAILSRSTAGLPATTVFGGTLLRQRARGDDGILADRNAFENRGVHSDPNVVGDDDGRGAEWWDAVDDVQERRKRARVNQSLRRLERMKIGVGDPDVPGNQAIRSNLDPLLRHDDRAIQQSEVSDRARPFRADRKRATGITGNMIAKFDGAPRSRLRRKRKNCAVSQ